MNGLIAHGILCNNKGEILIIRRCKYREGGRLNFQPERWDFPGGTVEKGELPQDAVVREVFEEVGMDVEVERIAYEFSNYDEKKDKVFTTLVYVCNMIGNREVKLHLEEHDQYEWISVEELLITTKFELVNYIIPSIKNISK